MKSPSPDHAGKILVIKNELNRLSYEIALAIGKIAREKYLKKI